MQVKRLLKLADFLVSDAIQDAWFDMGTWASRGWKQRECGSAACAFGWATACFPKSGLKLIQSYDSDLPGILYTSNGKEYLNIDAAVAFFGLSSEQADNLFLSGYYHNGENTTREQVARRIRQLVKEKG